MIQDHTYIALLIFKLFHQPSLLKSNTAQTCKKHVVFYCLFHENIYKNQIISVPHGFQVPLHKVPDWLWNTIDKWLRILDDKLAGDKVPEIIKSVLENRDLKAETQWLKNRLENENSPVVFCHNDLQEGNILISRDVDLENNGDPEIVIIGKKAIHFSFRRKFNSKESIWHF